MGYSVASGSQAVQKAQQWLGTPYCYGGGHNGSIRVGTCVDCSGLVNQVYGTSGNTGSQVRLGESVPSLNSAGPGDLVFFGSLAQGEPYHVGIFVGGNSMIDAPHTGTSVRYDSINGFGSIFGIRRLVPTNTQSGSANNPSGSQIGQVQFTYAQLEGIWIQAGGNPTAAPTAAAIAMAESGGNSQATDNDSNGSVDRGLWQINSVHGAQSTYDVMGNARAAVAISNNGSNWSPWVTYSTGAYRRYLQSSVAPDMSVPINATNAAANQPGSAQEVISWGGIFDAGQCLLNPFNCNVGGAAGGVSSMIASNIVKGIVGAILNPLIQIMAGILGITAGGALMLLGLFMMIQSSETGRKLTGMGLTGAGMATGQPELMAAGGSQAGGITQAVGTQRTATIRGQQTQARQAAVQRSVTEREIYRSQQQAIRDDLRARSYAYRQQQTAATRSASSAQTAAQRSALSRQQHRQQMSRARQRARLADRNKPSKA